jgi:acyl dehydratase
MSEVAKGLYFEDFSVGQRFATLGKTITEAEIIQFAMTYDPQPFHIDREAARDSAFGGLIASGFQTFATAFRLFHMTGTIGDASLGSPGCDELRWHAPVRPGDTLTVTAEVEDIRASRSKPDRGVVQIRHRMHDQHGRQVLSYLGIHLIACKTIPA